MKQPASNYIETRKGFENEAASLKQNTIAFQRDAIDTFGRVADAPLTHAEKAAYRDQILKMIKGTERMSAELAVSLQQAFRER